MGIGDWGLVICPLSLGKGNRVGAGSQASSTMNQDIGKPARTIEIYSPLLPLLSLLPLLFLLSPSPCSWSPQER
jgi:hypothetical protein